MTKEVLTSDNYRSYIEVMIKKTGLVNTKMELKMLRMNIFKKNQENDYEVQEQNKMMWLKNYIQTIEQ